MGKMPPSLKKTKGGGEGMKEGRNKRGRNDGGRKKQRRKEDGLIFLNLAMKGGSLHGMR